MIVPGLAGVAAITAAEEQTCALMIGGSIQCWGQNAYGQLGNGSKTTSSSPVAVSGFPSGVIGISAGAFHTCALTAAGDLTCWGYNGQGQLGNGGATSATTAVAVSGLSRNVVTVSNAHTTGIRTCALTNAGSAQCWGSNSFHALGGGPGFDGSTNILTPIPVEGTQTWVAISLGGAHTCALTNLGSVSCWGSNSEGQVGNSSAGSETDAPLPVLGLPSGVIAVSAGDNHSCALTRAGTVWCWGSNGSGQLGDGAVTSNPQAVPTAVVGLPTDDPVVAIAAGLDFTLALTTTGHVFSWGGNVYGDLGDNSTARSALPVEIPLDGVKAIVAGDDHACVLLAGGTVECWGYNGDYELGVVTSGPQSYVPIPVSSLLPPGNIAVTAGKDSSCALSNTGATWCWGGNYYGELGRGSIGSVSSVPMEVSTLGAGVTAVTAGQNAACALTTAGMVQCWGSDNAGQLGDGDPTYATQSTPVPIDGLAHDNRLTVLTPPAPPTSMLQMSLGSSPLNLAASASSMLAPTFSTLTPDRCRIINNGANSNSVSFLSSGICMVETSQAGGGTFNPAPSQTREIIVVPAVPTGLTASVVANGNNTDTVTLTWNAATGASTYTVDWTSCYRFCTPDANVSNLTATTLVRTVPSNVVGQTYYHYRVRAVDAMGQSATSGTVSIVTR